MNYEINVTKEGMHFFATHARSITTEKKMREVYAELTQAFPIEKGYSVTVTKRTEISEIVYIPYEKEKSFGELYKALNEASMSATLIVPKGKMQVTFVKADSISEGYKIYAYFNLEGEYHSYHDKKLIKWFSGDKIGRDNYYDDIIEHVQSKEMESKWLETHNFYFK